jgi:hypothetical protein
LIFPWQLASALPSTRSSRKKKGPPEYEAEAWAKMAALRERNLTDEDAPPQTLARE